MHTYRGYSIAKCIERLVAKQISGGLGNTLTMHVKNALPWYHCHVVAEVCVPWDRTETVFYCCQELSFVQLWRMQVQIWSSTESAVGFQFCHLGGSQLPLSHLHPSTSCLAQTFSLEVAHPWHFFSVAPWAGWRMHQMADCKTLYASLEPQNLCGFALCHDVIPALGVDLCRSLIERCCLERQGSTEFDLK